MTSDWLLYSLICCIEDGTQRLSCYGEMDVGKNQLFFVAPLKRSTVYEETMMKIEEQQN